MNKCKDVVHRKPCHPWNQRKTVKYSLHVQIIFLAVTGFAFARYTGLAVL